MDVIEINKRLAAKVLAVMGQLHLEDDSPRGKSQWGCHRSGSSAGYESRFRFGGHST